MRYLSILLLSVMIPYFVLGGAEGLCPRIVETVEWLGPSDLGFDLDVPDLNANGSGGLKGAEVEENDSEEEDSQNATDEDGIDQEDVDQEGVEEAAPESMDLEEVDLTLLGDVTGNVDLTLFRSGDVLFGTGSLTAGGVKSEVGASGSVEGDGLLLHLVPLDGSRLYLLMLDIEDGEIRGSYEAFGPEGLLLSGRADSSFFS
jgi:hypothetical protein